MTRLKSYYDIREKDEIQILDNAITDIMDVCEYDKSLVQKTVDELIVGAKAEYWRLKFADKSLQELLVIKDLLASDKLMRTANELAKDINEDKIREEVPSVKKEKSSKKDIKKPSGQRKAIK